MSGTKSSTTRRDKIRGPRQRKKGSVEQNAADRSLRKAGIRVMGNVPWGAHICVFYETKEDLLDTAAPYFAAGLNSNEFCVWAVSEAADGGRGRDGIAPSRSQL